VFEVFGKCGVASKKYDEISSVVPLLLK